MWTMISLSVDMSRSSHGIPCCGMDAGASSASATVAALVVGLADEAVSPTLVAVEAEGSDGVSIEHQGATLDLRMGLRSCSSTIGTCELMLERLDC
jgi:hypothetical protein